MASEVVTALIGGVAGLFTGAIASLAAPWSQWGVEQRRVRHQRRTDLIAAWRAGIEEQRAIEDEISPLIHVPRLPQDGGDFHLEMVVGSTDPPRGDVRARELVRQLGAVPQCRRQDPANGPAKPANLGTAGQNPRATHH